MANPKTAMANPNPSAMTPDEQHWRNNEVCDVLISREDWEACGRPTHNKETEYKGERYLVVGLTSARQLGIVLTLKKLF